MAAEPSVVTDAELVERLPRVRIDHRAKGEEVSALRVAPAGLGQTPAIKLISAGCENCARLNSPATRPSRSTMMRRLRFITSGSSDEMTMRPSP